MLIGNPFKYVTHTVEIRSVGRVSMVIGRGVCLVIGEADRGPAMEPVFLSNAAKARSFFGSGKAMEGCVTAFQNGVNMVVGFRVLGTGYATASKTLNDKGDVAAGTLTATSDGAWGNIPISKIENGDADHTYKDTIQGNGLQLAYALEFDDIVEHVNNWLKVGSTTKIIVYASEELAAGKVYINKTAGTATFYTNEWPATNQVITLSLKHKTRKIIMQDGTNRPEVYNNIASVTQLQSKLRYSAIATYTPAAGVTHLPAPTATAFVMEGGSDGAAITTDDWEDAFDACLKLPYGIIPTTSCITAYEVETGTYDLIAKYDGFLMQCADKMIPHSGFVSLNINDTVANWEELAQGYNNMWLTLIANGQDENGLDIAPARAGKTAALELGADAAEAVNCMNGLDGLMLQLDDADTERCTTAGIDVIVKETGIKPYAGITSNKDENFKLVVDIITLNWAVVALNYVINRFYHARRTKENLGRIQSSMTLLLEEQRRMQVLDDYAFHVTPNESDRNAVDTDMWIQCVGHMLRFKSILNMGYWSSNIA